MNLKRICTLLALTTLTLCSGVLAYDEIPVNVSADQVAAIAAAAPKLPVDLDLDLDLELVDYIDCTNPDDLHPMIDQGTSSFAEGPAGKYRVTAAHRHAFFAYRWKAAKADVPHVLVVEYPDDDKREICFLTHESKMSGRSNIDWSLETGVYTGNPYPITNASQYHTMFFWPQDKWPVIMVGNWNRKGAPAAASRIWVYRVKGEKLPAMDVKDADTANPRIIGDLYNWSLVPVHHIFGRVNRATAFKHIVEYYQYLGNNMVSWPVVSNNNWGFKCRVDAWDGNDDDDELTGILTECDAKGMKFIATFEIGRGFTINGKKVEEDPEAFRAGLLKGFDEFIKRYGKYESLYGIAFGTPDFGPPYGNATIDILKETGGIESFTKFIHDRKKDLKVMTFIGAQDLHMQYFNDAWGVLSRWENSDVKWSKHLANEVMDLWEKWGRDPKELGKVNGLTLVNQYQGDDHGIYNSYSQQPRSMMYLDIDTSQARSDNINTRSVMLWNTFYEAWLGLHPDVNFWYRKLWVAPDFNHSEPYAGSSWARAMEHRDRDMIIAGAWNRKAGGHEATLRRFAKAFRELPPVELKEFPNVGGDAVKVRKAVYNGKTYVSAINLSPFDELLELAIDSHSRKVPLKPFAAETIILDGDANVSARMRTSMAYKQFTEDRINHFDRLRGQLANIDPKAATKQYESHVDNAKKLMRQGDIHAANIALGYGLTAELELRRTLMRPKRIVVPKVAKMTPGEKSIKAWPADALEINADDGSFISSHLYFPNSWSGQKDLSAIVKMCHDGQKLYIGVKVSDNLLTKKDGVEIWLSKANYRNWRENSQKLEFTTNTPAPQDRKSKTGENSKVKWNIKPAAGGYYYFAAIDLEANKIDVNEPLGYLVRVSDHDDTPNVKSSSWARKTVMMIPHDENFANWGDARNVFELVFAP